MNFWGGIREPTKKKGELFSELDMTSLPTNEIQNEETKERNQRRIVSCLYFFLLISISAHCVHLGWNQRAKKKEGRAVFWVNCDVSSKTDEIRNEETKERRCRRRNVAPARRDRRRCAAKCGGGMRRHCTVADSRCIGRQLSKQVSRHYGRNFQILSKKYDAFMPS